MPNLAEICAQCKAKQVQEIIHLNNLIHEQGLKIKEYESNPIIPKYAQLQAENEQLKTTPQQSETITKLLDLLEPDIIGREKIINHDPRIIEIIEVYRTIRPRKGG
jgi:hypothetical protein